MATTTFSGPIKAGTIKNTTGTTVGTDMKNTGQVVMAQTHAIDLSGGALAAVATDVIIPANSQLIDIVFDSITASSGATNISIGKVGGGAAIFVNTFAIGTTDVRLNVTNSAATSSGECRFTILYQQNINLD